MRKSFFAALVSPLLLAQVASAYKPGYQNSYGSKGADHAGGHDLDKDGHLVIGVSVADSAGLSRRQLGVAAPTCTPVNGATACGGGDIALIKSDTGGSTIWAASFGTAGADVSSSVAAGPNAYYVTGTADGQAFVAKASMANGKIDVFKVIAATGTTPTDVKVHPGGDVFVAGYSTTGISDCYKQTAKSDAFLCRFDGATLDRKWCVPLGSSADATTTMHPGGSIAFDGHGYVYWAGTTTGSVDTKTPNFGGKDAWAAKFDVNGNKVFAFNHGTEKDDEGTAVAVDQYNDWLFIAGHTAGELALDGKPSHGGVDVFISRTQDLSAPTLNWTSLYGGPGDDYASDIFAFRERLFFVGTADPQGKKSPWTNDTVYVWYNTDPWGKKDLVACELVHVDNRFAETYPYVDTGVLKWCSLFGSSGDDSGRTVRVDSGWNMTFDGDTTGAWGTNIGVVLPFRGETDAIMQQYYEYEPPEWTTKTALTAPSPIKAAQACPNVVNTGSAALPTATVAPTGSAVQPTASATGPAATSTTTTSRPSSAQAVHAEGMLKLASLILALVFAVFAAL